MTGALAPSAPVIVAPYTCDRMIVVTMIDLIAMRSAGMARTGVAWNGVATEVNAQLPSPSGG